MTGRDTARVEPVKNLVTGGILLISATRAAVSMVDEEKEYVYAHVALIT